MNTNDRHPSDDAAEDIDASAGSGDEEKRGKIDIGLTNFFNLKGSEVNVKSLEPEEINKYLDGITFVIGRLGELFKNSKKYSFKVPFEDKFDTKKEFCEFIDMLITFFSALKRKFFLQNKGINASSLSIDPTDSGFPHLTDLWNFTKDIESAEAQLAQLPPLDEILERARAAIFKGEMPVREQMMYARHNYFSLINGKDIISDFKIFKPELIGQNSSEALYKVNFYGFDQRYNIFNFYSMLLTQSVDSIEKLHNDPEHKFFLTIRDYCRQELFNFAHQLDSADRYIHPKILIKYTVGPYYCDKTMNADNIQNLFDTVGNADPFMFKFDISGIVSIKTIKESSLFKQFFNHLAGYANSKEIFSDKFVYNYMIVPFKIKQFLKDRDEADRPCKIFGMLDGGELVE